jgi:hypothetical protein
MSGVAAPARLTAIQPQPLGTLVEAWGGSEQLARVLAALRGCLADDALPPLPAEVRTLVPGVTWGQVADTMRIAESPQWAHGLTVAKSAMGHQMLWLMLGGDSPSPRQFRQKHHGQLRKALWSQIAEHFDAEAVAAAKRAKKAGGAHDLVAARAATASRLPWSAPADVLVLRALMTDPTSGG